jgi:formate/nitrite transporter FocA (FNT family)
MPHVIAGNVETFYLVSAGSLTLWNCISGYVIPVLLGNIIGGVALVAVGAHAEFIEASDLE